MEFLNDQKGLAIVPKILKNIFGRMLLNRKIRIKNKAVILRARLNSELFLLGSFFKR